MQAATLSQLLVFQLAAREYALPIESIVEVLRMVALAPVAHSPAWLSGVVNLRGRVVPVLDLRVRLGLPSQPVDLTTPLVIVALHELVFGLIVDSATEVLGVSADYIEMPGALSGDNHMLSGIARHGVYRSWSFRDGAAELQPRYFTRHDDAFELAQPIRRLVQFEYLNLVEDAYPSLLTNTHQMDLILCRNVLIYFAEEMTRRVAWRLYQSLAAEGWLIVGHAEPSQSVFQRGLWHARRRRGAGRGRKALAP